jgi:hypothetical protein
LGRLASSDRVDQVYPLGCRWWFVAADAEFQQLLACVPAAHYGGVHIQEIARESAAEQSADLVSDSVVGMQDRPDGKLNRIVSTPVDSRLDLLLGVAFRASQGQPGRTSRRS